MKYLEFKKISIADLIILGAMVLIIAGALGVRRLEVILEKKDIPLFATAELSVFPERVIQKAIPVGQQGAEIERIAKTSAVPIPKIVEESLSTKAPPKSQLPPLKIAPPAILSQTIPEYPLEAVEKGWEGAVIVRLLVQKDGRVGRVKVDLSSGYSVLDQVAIQEVKEWEFEPAKRGGTPIEAWFTVPIKFQLKA